MEIEKKNRFLQVKCVLKSIRMRILLSFKYKLRSCGKQTYICGNVIIRPESVSVGYKSFIGPGCWLASEVDIGNFVMLAGRVAIVGGDHKFDVVGVPSIEAGRSTNKKVIIEDDVWVGHGAIIMHGVTIGEGAVIGAGSIVTKDVAPYSIVAGVPARLLRMRFHGRDIEKHKDALRERREQFARAS